MSDMRQRRIEAGSLIPDDMVTPEVERLSRAFWDGERASDGFSSGWDYIPASHREVIRAGVVALLAEQSRDRAGDDAAPATGMTVEQIDQMIARERAFADKAGFIVRPIHLGKVLMLEEIRALLIAQPESGTHDVCATCNGTGWIPEDEYFDKACPDCTHDAGVEP